jgi:hypothetical protein
VIGVDHGQYRGRDAVGEVEGLGRQLPDRLLYLTHRLVVVLDGVGPVQVGQERRCGRARLHEGDRDPEGLELPDERVRETFDRGLGRTQQSDAGMGDWP